MDRIAEEYQTIKRRLLGNIALHSGKNDRHSNLVMITSAIPGEGKTYTTVNLAMSLTMELDRTVLVIDTDFIKQSLSRLFGIHEYPGLFDVLERDDVDLVDVLIRTNVENLVLLPSGKSTGAVTETLASEAMGALNLEISQRYPDRIIVFDTPPLLSTTGTAALAVHVGQVVLVVEAEKTPEGAITDALHVLEPVEVTGMILNKSRDLSFGTNYGYGYRNK